MGTPFQDLGDFLPVLYQIKEKTLEIQGHNTTAHGTS